MLVSEMRYNPEISLIQRKNVFYNYKNIYVAYAYNCSTIQSGIHSL